MKSQQDKKTLPLKKSLIDELTTILDDEETRDKDALKALKLLLKFDRKNGIQKVIEMRNSGKNRMAVLEICLTLSSAERKSSEIEMFDIEEAIDE